MRNVADKALRSVYSTACGAAVGGGPILTRAVILAQLYELATNYGKIDYGWLDMPSWTGWMPNDLSTQEVYNFLKTKNPERSTPRGWPNWGNVSKIAPCFRSR